MREWYVTIVRDRKPACPASCCHALGTLIEQFAKLSPSESRPPGSGTPGPRVAVYAGSLQYIESMAKQVAPGDRTLAVVCEGPRGQGQYRPDLVAMFDDFMFCPFTPAELRFRVQRLMRGDGDAGPEPGSAPEALVGGNAAFRQAIDRIGLIARTSATALILGETGTGKEIVARAIHYQSNRSGRPFVPINCGAIPDHLFENELFGHTKGAFTDASTCEAGLLSEAEGGTLFFDEIDSLSPAAQIKVLRFLQEKEYRPLGGRKTLHADVRVVAASNADLLSLIEQRTFRQDLYHRLNVVSISIPALRDRLDDVPDLVRHFISRHLGDCRFRTPQVSAAALRRLLTHSWPGNVRELERVVHRALILASSPLLEPGDFELTGAPPACDEKCESFQAAKQRAINEFERDYLRTVLVVHGGNITQAANAAGKERRAFQRLVSKYGLDRKVFGKSA